MGLLDRIRQHPVSSDPPEAIDVGPGGAIVIRWSPVRTTTIPATRLRDACPCAQCVEEGTGRKLLDPATIPEDIRPLQITAVGNYAIQIHWSDGHGTGIYSWETLRQISEP
jgi:DUF971 family protein